MVLEYFNYKRWKRENPKESEENQKPVLNEEDEKLLHRITSQDASAPALPEQPTVILDDGKEVEGKEAQEALKEGAGVPLPGSPAPESKDKGEASEESKAGEESQAAEESKAGETSNPSEESKPSEESQPSEESKSSEEGKGGDEKKEASEEEKKKQSYWSYLPAMPSYHFKHKDKEQTAEDLKAAADDVKKGGAVDLNKDGKIDEKEAEKNEEDLGSILDRLNLAAVNNRVFSFSKESQELLEKFKQVLKDIVNGVPTAYDDLENLLRDSEGQLNKMYGNLPPFLQTLIKSLPAKMTGTLGPQLLAAAAERPGADAKVKAAAAAAGAETEQGDKKKVKKSKVPPLKKLVSEQGAVASMLRSIFNFLQLRFPAFVTGTNVLMSLAVFILLFVFWYCYKRGRETRLEKERQGIQATESDAEESVSASEQEDSDTEKPRDASEEDVESPIAIHGDPAVGDKPSSAVADMAAALDQAEPKDVSLPESEAGKETKEATVEPEKK